ncbi:DUF3293 domain-containing protein [Alcaligenes faecalis]|jgi:hypothetical protein|uniref:DUF3293 domain-containing protein n=1 Tax=Alcaligenes faecalis TaxID=511 RepID=A0ABY7N756_ALCFA|nr:DUF3293 domain-containing protein [Alcaligenes faecalis]WBM39025.1 DUF3293 domain-containing protein [Alcaligenes faecalis]
MSTQKDLPAALSHAFEKAIYRVHSPQGDMDVRIGQLNRPLNQLLERENSRGAAILTACNPGAQICSRAFNDAVQESLLRDLQKLDLRWWPAVNLDPKGKWPDEPSLLVLDISLQQARWQARLFKQLAFVYIPLNGKPQLHQVQQRLPVSNQADLNSPVPF